MLAVGCPRNLGLGTLEERAGIHRLGFCWQSLAMPLLALDGQDLPCVYTFLPVHFLVVEQSDRLLDVFRS